MGSTLIAKPTDEPRRGIQSFCTRKFVRQQRDTHPSCCCYEKYEIIITSECPVKYVRNTAVAFASSYLRYVCVLLNWWLVVMICKHRKAHLVAAKFASCRCIAVYMSLCVSESTKSCFSPPFKEHKTYDNKKEYTLLQNQVTWPDHAHLLSPNFAHDLTTPMCPLILHFLNRTHRSLSAHQISSF